MDRGRPVPSGAPGAYTGTVPGRDETRNVISEVLGLKIDHTVVVDLKGFSQLIDAMGGVTINVKLSGFGTKLPIGGHSDGNGGVIGESGYFSPGRQHLSGNLALWYARTRAADSDTYRQARQRCVVQAVVKQVDPAQMVSKYPEIARIARDNIYTDIPAQNLPAFVDLIERVQKSGKINSLSLTQIPNFNSVRPDYDEIHAFVQKGIAAPKPATTSRPPPRRRRRRRPRRRRRRPTTSADRWAELMSAHRITTKPPADGRGLCHKRLRWVSLVAVDLE